MTINITVLLKSKEEHTEKLKGLLENLVASSRQEPGCVQYDLHQDVQDSSTFVFHEVWENKEALGIHNSQEYFKSFFAQAPDLLLEKPQIIVTNKLA